MGRRVGDPHAGARITGGLIVDAARAGAGVGLAVGTIAHDDLASGRLVRPIPESMELGNGYWLLLDTAAADRPEVQAFRAWLREEIAACFGLPSPAPSEAVRSAAGPEGPPPEAPDPSPEMERSPSPPGAC